MAVEKKGKGTKTKLVAKTGGGEVRQWDIMKMMLPGNDEPYWFRNDTRKTWVACCVPSVDVLGGGPHNHPAVKLLSVATMRGEVAAVKDVLAIHYHDSYLNRGCH